MSAAFALSASGPPVRCSFPKCVLEAFHDGNHEFAQVKADKRVEFPGPLYGTCIICGAKFAEYGDYGHPTSRICGATECGLDLLRRETRPLPVLCPCPQREYPHELMVHAQTASESYNPKFKYRWPVVAHALATRGAEHRKEAVDMKSVDLYQNRDGTWTARIFAQTFTGTREQCGGWLRMNGEEV